MTAPHPTAATVTPRPPTTACPGTAARVLVIEDDATVSEVVQAYLERAGFAVLARPTGTADSPVPPGSPDLLALDLMLPGLCGLEGCSVGSAPRPSRCSRWSCPRWARRRPHPGARARRRRLPRQAVQPAGAGVADAGRAALPGLASWRLPPVRHLLAAGDGLIDLAARTVQRGGVPLDADRPGVRPAGLPRRAPGLSVHQRRAASPRVGLGLRGHLDGDGPRPAAPREGRSRPLRSATPADRLGRRLPPGGPAPGRRRRAAPARRHRPRPCRDRPTSCSRAARRRSLGSGGPCGSARAATCSRTPPAGRAPVPPPGCRPWRSWPRSSAPPGRCS